MTNIKLSRKYGYLVIDGKFYQEKLKGNESYFEEVSTDHINKLESKGAELAARLRENLDREAVLREAIRQLTPKEVNGLYELVFKGKKSYIPKTREGHCLDMKVGNFVIPIVNDI